MCRRVGQSHVGDDGVVCLQTLLRQDADEHIFKFVLAKFGLFTARWVNSQPSANTTDRCVTETTDRCVTDIPLIGA